MTQALPRLAFLVSVLLLAPGCGESGPAANEVAVHVETVAIDRETRSPVVILEEEGGTRRLPIWIGHAEASSIDHRLRKQTAIRPNTHDLAKRLVDGLGGEVRRVVVSDLEDGIYYARIVLHRDGGTVEIDARPSDAIAIALRTGAALFVVDSLFEEALEDDLTDENARRI